MVDRETFPEPFRSVFQSIADQVASEVDKLIPGSSLEEASNRPIVCFEAPASWRTNQSHPPPLTLIGAKLEGEPSQTEANTVRIALNDTLPLDKWRFILQLSHELAHVKMNPKFSNYLVETFAVAVSYEVLRRMGLYGYQLRVAGEDIQALPENIQSDLAFQKYVEVSAYWQTRASKQGIRMDDRPLQTLGALLLNSTPDFGWSHLLGIAKLVGDCPFTSPDGFELCSPDIAAMQRHGLKLESLGYAHSKEHHSGRVRATMAP